MERSHSQYRVGNTCQPWGHRQNPEPRPSLLSWRCSCGGPCNRADPPSQVPAARCTHATRCGTVTTAEASSQSSGAIRAQTVPCSAEPQDWLALTVAHELQPISVAFGSFKCSGAGGGLGCPSGAGAWRREVGGAGKSGKFQPAGSSIVCDFEGRWRKQHGNVISSPRVPQPVKKKTPPSNRKEKTGNKSKQWPEFPYFLTCFPHYILLPALSV